MARPRRAANLPAQNTKVSLESLRDLRTLVEQIVKGDPLVDPLQFTIAQRRNCVELMRYGLKMDVARIARSLRVSTETIRSDLRVIHIQLAQQLNTADIYDAIVGELLSKIEANYQMALEKRDVSGANKATEALKELMQDLGKITKASQVIEHKGIDILDLARAASPDDDIDVIVEPIE